MAKLIPAVTFMLLIPIASPSKAEQRIYKFNQEHFYNKNYVPKFTNGPPLLPNVMAASVCK